MSPEEENALEQWTAQLAPVIEPSPAAAILPRLAEPLMRARQRAAQAGDAALASDLDEAMRAATFLRAVLNERSRALADMRVRPTDPQIREAEELCRLYMRGAVEGHGYDDVVSRILASLRNRAQEDARAESMVIEALLSLCTDLAVYAALTTGKKAGPAGALEVTDTVLSFRRAED